MLHTKAMSEFISTPSSGRDPGLEEERTEDESSWRRYLQRAVSSVRVQRPHLFRRALESDARWIGIAASPGMGRTTLLRQIAAELDRTGEPHAALWTPRRTEEAYETFLLGHRGSSGRAVALLRRAAAAGPSGRFTLIIDDLDLVSTERRTGLLRDLLVAVPGLRVVTATLLPVDATPAIRVHLIAEDRLHLDYEEARDCVLRTVAQLGGDPPRESEIRGAFESTRGVPLGIGFAIDRFLRPGRSTDMIFAEMINAVRDRLSSAYPAEVVEASYWQMLATLSLLPRFTDQHVALLFPSAPPGAARQLGDSRLIEPGDALRSGEYVWCGEFWAAALQRNCGARETRRRLAAKLRDSGDVGGAFDQWVFAGELPAAERALRDRFLTIYETSAPEAQEQLLAIPAEELREFPLLRTMRILLDPDASPHYLSVSAQNLAGLAKKAGPGQAPLALAVRASVLARLGEHQEAVAQAERVIAAGQMQAEQAAEDRLTGAEAALVAALTLLVCRGYPRGGLRLPDCAGSAHLVSRRALLQAVLDATRAAGPRSTRVPAADAGAGYRSLVFSASQCTREIRAFDGADRVFADALRAEQGTVPQGGPEALVAEDMPSLLRVPAECLRRVMTGNLSGAMRLAYEPGVPAPVGGVLRAMLHLAKGQAGEALVELDRLGPVWGERVAAVEAVLRACALHRRGFAEAARLVLYEAEGVSDVALAQALMLLSPADGRAIAELGDRFDRLHAASQSVGVLRTGAPSSGQPPLQALTRKEHAILLELRRGLNTREIADQGHLSVNTVRAHVRSIARKLNASGQADILRRAWQLRLFEE
ncbi:helix-turn-helix transcriptional regulator [Leucobacter sp.]